MVFIIKDEETLSQDEKESPRDSLEYPVPTKPKRRSRTDSCPIWRRGQAIFDELLEITWHWRWALFDIHMWKLVTEKKTASFQKKNRDVLLTYTEMTDFDLRISYTVNM